MFALDGGSNKVTRHASETRAQAGVFSTLTRLLGHEQGRWFYWLPIFMASGIGLYFSLSFEPGYWLVLPWLMLVAGLAILRPRSLYSLLILGAVIAAGFGGLCAKLKTDWVWAPTIQATIGPVAVEGWAERIEKREGEGRRLTLIVTGIEGFEDNALPRRVRLFVRAADLSVSPGDHVRLKATLRPPPIPSLPGGYDFARTAWFKQLGGVGYGSGEITQISASDEPPWRYQFWSALAQVRAKIGARVSSHLEGSAGAIAEALLTGERGQIPEQVRKDLRHSGLAHILAISGLHMAIMSGAVFWLIRALLALSPRLALNWPIKKWSAVIAIMGALFYLGISGASSSTQRAFLMIVLFYVAIMLDRPGLSLRNVAIAALLILTFWPESLLNIGFQMSFAAVTALIAFYESWNDSMVSGDKWLWRYSPLGRIAFFFLGIVLTTIVAGLAIAPISAFHFGREAGYSLIANLLALPVFMLITMPMALLALIVMPFGFEGAPLALMGAGIELITFIAAWVAALPGAVLNVAEVPFYALLPVVLGALWMMIWRERWRYLGLIAIAVGLTLFQHLPRPDILIGENARAIALRHSGGESLPGQLSAPRGMSRSFELARWLEKDGDGRPPGEVARGQGFECDSVGCVSRQGSLLVAYSRHASGLRDDCARADILILRFRLHRPCARPKLIIDRAEAARMGTHAIYIEGDRLRVETVAAHRGQRPWSRNPRTHLQGTVR